MINNVESLGINILLALTLSPIKAMHRIIALHRALKVSEALVKGEQNLHSLDLATF